MFYGNFHPFINERKADSGMKEHSCYRQEQKQHAGCGGRGPELAS